MTNGSSDCLKNGFHSMEQTSRISYDNSSYVDVDDSKRHWKVDNADVFLRGLKYTASS